MARTARLIVMAVPLAWLPAPPCGAEHVVFQDGRTMKVVRYTFEGENIAVELPGGASMRFNASVVARIAPEDGVSKSPVTPPPAPQPAAPAVPEWLSQARPELVDSIQRIAALHEMDPALVAAVIKVESNFETRAVSRKGAQGLMQIMPGTARDLGLQDPFDGDANLEAGVRYLRGLLNRYQGDVKLALAAYNAGAQVVDRSRGIPDYPETRQYVERILSLLKALD